MTKMKFRDATYIISTAFMLTTFIVVSSAFFIALTHNFSVLVTINEYGEAWIELPIFIIGTLSILLRYGLYEPEIMRVWRSLS